MAGELVDKILRYLVTCDEVDSLTLANIFEEDHQKIIGAIKSLQALENDTIQVEPLSLKTWKLTDEGCYVIKNGSHEAAVYNAIPENGIAQSELIKKVKYGLVGFSKAIALGWIQIDKSSGTPMVRKKVTKIVDAVKTDLENINNIEDSVKKAYTKRKLLQELVIKSFLLRKGSNFSIKVEKLEADLTADLLLNDAWKQKSFKPYNFNALGQTVDSGHLHPLMKVRSEFRKIFIEMGFEEMPTNNFVESSFWNFDALFVPQQHPARDDHDTFFISEPKLTLSLPNDYLERVKEVHSKGGYGSQGYRYDWKLDEAKKNVLRTHTTAVSARMLHKLMQNGEFKPVKFFSIDRVFRNETLDATHLAEFHQVEGVVADYNLTLGNLIGILYEFFSKLGITQLQFKPAYNPYTEPSMEIFCFHNGLGKWIEIGNSGVFRPEMLLPMKLPESVNIIAWGLSLERPTMIKYGLNNIRDLVGPKVDLQMVHDSPLCRLDKHSSKNKLKAQTNELDKLWDKINGQMGTDIKDIQFVANETEPVSVVVFCNIEHPLLFLEPLFNLLQGKLTLAVSVHLHSSVTPQSRSKFRSYDFRSKDRTNYQKTDIKVTVIYHGWETEPRLKANALTEIVGVVNIARYLNRVIESKVPGLLPYESKGPVYANQIDTILDEIQSSMMSSGRSTRSRTSMSAYVMGDVISIVDIIYQSMGK